MKKNTLILLVVVALGIIFFADSQLLVFDTAISKSVDSVTLRMKTYNNGVVTEDYLIKRTKWEYQECQPNMPGYGLLKYGEVYSLKSYNVISDLSNYTGKTLFKVSPTIDLYANPDLTIITQQKPRQHPDCIQDIRDFVNSAGVNVTEIVYVNNVVTVNNTVVEHVYTNNTIYVCPDKTVSSTPSNCASPIAVEPNTIYVDRDVYICSDGNPTFDKDSCENPVQINSVPWYKDQVNWLIIIGIAAIIYVYLSKKKVY